MYVIHNDIYIKFIVEYFNKYINTSCKLVVYNKEFTIFFQAPSSSKIILNSI